MLRHLAIGLDQIPVDEPADFGARDRVFGHQALVALERAACFVDIFGDHRCADDRLVGLGEQNRQRRRRVQLQKLLAPRPGLFLDQRQILAIFAKGQADETAGCEKRMVEQGQHGYSVGMSQGHRAEKSGLLMVRWLILGADSGSKATMRAQL
jgi:hypothetical protein